VGDRARRLTLGLGLWACACGEPTLDETVEDFLRRVERVTETQVAAAYTPTVQSYPPLRELRLETTDLRIGLLDFVDLQGCGLQVLIGERNSSLGRVMPPSQRLLYEHRLTRELDACITALVSAGEEADLVTDLRRIAGTKAQELPLVFWNATFAAPEMGELFSLAGPPLPRAGPDVGAATQALEWLGDLPARLGDSSLVLTSEALERRYQALQAARAGGDLLRAMDRLTWGLSSVAATLEARRAQRPLCFRATPSQQGEILHNVFREIYGGRVQPALARVHREGGRLLTAAGRLREGQSVEAEAFALWAARHLSLRGEGAWPRFEGAITQHAAAWQGVFDECGLSAGEG
jgi:hypothetical protein